MLIQKFKIFIILFIFINLTACATTKVNEFYNNVAPLIEKQDISGAVNFASSFYENCDKYNKFLYAIELGLLYHLNDKYTDSNKIFEEAKSIYSLKDYTSTFFNDDILLPSYYLGEDYEMAYINFFCALNYLKTKKLKQKRNEAVVEARQANNLFNKIKIDTPKSIYQDDPFIRYFMGIVYQNAGYYNDALVSYKLSLLDFSDNNIAEIDIPQNLIDNLYTLYKYYSMDKEASNLLKEFPLTKENDIKSNGSLIVVNYNGLAPIKVEQKITIPINQAWNKYYNRNNNYKFSVIEEFDLEYVSAIFPIYQYYKNKIKSFIVEIIEDTDSNKTKTYYTKSFLATNIGLILDKHLGEPDYRKVFYSILNNYVIGYREIEAIKDEYIKEVIEIKNSERSVKDKEKLLRNLYNSKENKISYIKERLKRLNKVSLTSWHSLPEEINIATISLNPGKYNIIIKYLDKNNNIIYKTEKKTKIKKGKNRFVITKSYLED